MPELPEVETIARGLALRYPGRVLSGARVKHADMLAPPLTASKLGRRLKDRRIERVGRFGKNVLIEMDSELRLLINLGMTGRLVPADAAGAAALRHVAVAFTFRDAPDILFDDVRRFGRVELHDAASWETRAAQIGVDPFDPSFGPLDMHRLTKTSATPIRNWLLDQRRIAGVGNIYASEALFRARIHPARRARTLTRAEAGALLEELRTVLQTAIDARGTTMNDYLDAEGEAGDYWDQRLAYAREGEVCPRCETPIRRIVISNRSAFFCPFCQPRSGRRPNVSAEP
ncbi:MAG TPA: bifunctional DNA-formamidopyrimidine glycosylase/DNA-(apurinic or apyrimidinic site) lyase [Longimicrobiales bacterium]|nr:bifunctional DNA-formamidopyrimidine glycosylase/DNA-(apurinic or apyrimidinic site) lyase [Longimicrobiales bacterium]